MGQMVAKVTSLDEYAQAVDRRITVVREEIRENYQTAARSMTGSLEALERLAHGAAE